MAGEPASTTAIRRRLERDAELLRRQQVLVAAAERRGYARGFAEGLEHERRKHEAALAYLHQRLAQACREAAAAQEAVSREATVVVEIVPPAGTPGTPR